MLIQPVDEEVHPNAPEAGNGTGTDGVYAGAVAPISAANSRKPLWSGRFRLVSAC
jgi:hypothetical protein